VSLLYPVPIFQEDIAYRLWPESALALVRFGLVNSVEVRSQADLAGTYLCNNRADSSVYANIYS
jgi:hypothetical protein